MTQVPIDRFEHFYRLSADLAGRPEPFLLDTGIGLTIVAPDLGHRPGVQDLRTTYAGKRMSGQVVEVPLVRLPEIRVGDLVLPDVVAGVIDLGGGVEFTGILTPAVFAERPITIDPQTLTLTVGDPRGPVPHGIVVDLHAHQDEPAVDWSVDLVLPSGRVVRVEVDTGSGALILDTAYLADVGLTLDDPSIEVKTGTDETGHEWTRRWVRIDGAVHLEGAPETRFESPRVMFQDLALEGLVGTEFLDRYVTTYDLARGRLVLSPLG